MDPAKGSKCLAQYPKAQNSPKTLYYTVVGPKNLEMSLLRALGIECRIRNQK